MFPLESWIGIVTVALTVLGAEWAFFAYNARMFSKVYVKLDEVVEKLLNKLEYHERHDDKRFSAIRDDLWEMRLNNATREAKWVSRQKPCPPSEKPNGN